ncbi:MAG: ATP-dependent zinc metalloprotease FtsH, partial [Fidelibacterota bacterium]
EVATELARRMVVEWGMSEKVGPTTLGKNEQELFLGREIQQHKSISEQTSRTIDEEIRAIILAAERRASQILTDHMDQLKLLAQALLEHETVHGEDIPRLFTGKSLLKVSPNGRPKAKAKRGGAAASKKRTAPARKSQTSGASKSTRKTSGTAKPRKKATPTSSSTTKRTS